MDSAVEAYLIGGPMHDQVVHVDPATEYLLFKEENEGSVYHAYVKSGDLISLMEFKYIGVENIRPVKREKRHLDLVA